MQLDFLTEGMPVVYGGDRVAHVGSELAAAFQPGDRLVVVQSSGALLRIPDADARLVDAAVTAARKAVDALGRCSDEQISAFFAAFARRLADDEVFAAIAVANEADVTMARSRGRSTTRLVLSPKMRADMIDGLRVWEASSGARDRLVERVDHDGWTVEQRTGPLGVVGFVFEGRPNVFADACGVVRSGNTAVMRIGSDALGTARAIVIHALHPALDEAGLPRGTVGLLDSPAHASAWALCSHPGLALAVARGSGSTVAQLGAIARQSGIPASLHGTGGAWMVVSRFADEKRLASVVEHSLDRKVCNTLNVVCVERAVAEPVVPNVIAAADVASSARGYRTKLHIHDSARPFVPPGFFTDVITVGRAEGDRVEARAEAIATEDLGTEWEWEQTPELTVVVVDSIAEAIELFNTHSPRLVASLISDESDEHDAFYAAIDAPFVGDGFTRWVDGQFALGRPELGLSNWEHGRLFARSAVLSGDSIFTVRTRVRQSDPSLHR